MNILAHLSTNTIIISRMVPVSGNRMAFSTVTGGKSHIQPLSPEKTQLFDGVMGKTHMFYCPAELNILEGDRVRVIITGKIYKVKNGGVSRRTYGVADFLQVVCEEVT